MLILCRMYTAYALGVRYYIGFRRGNIVSSMFISFRVFGDTYRLMGIKRQVSCLSCRMPNKEK